MPGYLLDTDIVSYALRGAPSVVAKILHHRRSGICISSISLAELRFGAHRIGPSKTQSLIDSFIGDVAVLPFDREAANAFGTVATALARRGAPIGQFDTLIAAHALATGRTLVTNNIKHFGRVQGLHMENWMA